MDPRRISYQATHSHNTVLRTKGATETKEQKTHPTKTRPKIAILPNLNHYRTEQNIISNNQDKMDTLMPSDPTTAGPEYYTIADTGKKETP